MIVRCEYLFYPVTESIGVNDETCDIKKKRSKNRINFLESSSSTFYPRIMKDIKRP